MVTGSVSTSYNVQMPGFFKSFSSYANYVKFDPTSTLACLIMQFEYTFYHNVLLQATIPFVAFILVRGLVMVGMSQIRVSYNNRRRIAQDDDELEYLENEEEKDRINFNETATGLASQFLIFVHPNITEVMFNMFQCEPILGYINQWLTVDLRFQCSDYGWWIFAAIAFFMIVVYTLGLPIHYLVSLRRRRHRLEEAKNVVIKRYTAWRSHLKRAKDLRIPEDELAGSEEIARVDKEIAVMHAQYQQFRNEWDQFEFIYDGYKLQFYYWELVEMARKQMIVAVSGLLARFGAGFVFFAIHCRSQALSVLVCIRCKSRPSALPYVEARENFIKGGEIGTTYLTLFSALLIMLATASPEYNTPLLANSLTGIQVLFMSVVSISVGWNVREGFAEIERMREEQEEEENGSQEKITIFSVIFAVRLVNNAVRKTIQKRYEMEAASTIGGDSLLSSSISSHGRPGSGARTPEPWDDTSEGSDEPVSVRWHRLAQNRERWTTLIDKLVRLDQIPEPEISTQASEIAMLSEDTASVLNDWYLDQDPTSDDASEISSDSSRYITLRNILASPLVSNEHLTCCKARGGAIFSEEGVGIDRVDFQD
eukprot:766414-Hanusia_phi.AAC.1